MPNLKEPRKFSGGGGGGLGLRLAVAGVLVVLGIGIGWGLYGNTTSPLSFTTDPGAKSDNIPGEGADRAEGAAIPRRLQRPVRADAQEVRRHRRLRVGCIREDWATLHRADPNDNRRKIRATTYRGGWGDPDSSPDR